MSKTPGTRDQQPESDVRVRPLGAQHRINRHLLAGLVKAIDWFDNSLQNVRASHGLSPVHRTQSLILVHIASGRDTPGEIAREMGLTRQNVHHMARALIQDGLIEQRSDPRDPRRTQYRLADTAAADRDLALDTLAALEAALARRIGLTRDELDIVRRILAADWGPEIRSQQELDAALSDPHTADSKE
ncbi:MAG: helix-turn-helix domain-containing protein [Pseudomonadales bacterium]